MFPNLIRGNIKEVLFYHTDNGALRAWILADGTQYSAATRTLNARSTSPKTRSYIYDPEQSVVDTCITIKTKSYVPRITLLHHNNQMWQIVTSPSTGYEDLIRVYDATTGELLHDEESFLAQFPSLQGRIDRLEYYDNQDDYVLKLHTEDAQTSYYNILRDTLTFALDSVPENQELKETLYKLNRLRFSRRATNNKYESTKGSKYCKTYVQPKLDSLDSAIAEITASFGTEVKSLFVMIKEPDAPRRRKLAQIRVNATLLPEVRKRIKTYSNFLSQDKADRGDNLVESVSVISETIILNGKIITQDSVQALYSQSNIDGDPSITAVTFAGKKLWTVTQPYDSWVLIDSIFIFMSNDNKHWNAYDIRTGKALWSVKL